MNEMKTKIVILFFAVLAQAVYVFGEGLARELERECAKDGMCVLPDASRARIKATFEKRIAASMDRYVDLDEPTARLDIGEFLESISPAIETIQ